MEKAGTAHPPLQLAQLTLTTPRRSPAYRRKALVGPAGRGLWVPRGCGCRGLWVQGAVGQGPRLTGAALTLQYEVEPAQLATRWLQVSVWHLGTLTRRVFLGEVTIPLATWDFEDSTTQCFCWYPLRAKVTALPHPHRENKTHFSKGLEPRQPTRGALAPGHSVLAWLGLPSGQAGPEARGGAGAGRPRRPGARS